MARTFVGFDDSYRVPVPVNVSRAVSCGGIVHLCGQLHMDSAGNTEDPCDLVAQGEGVMRRLYDVFGHAGLAGEDMAQLHVFYRNDGSINEARYAERIAGLVRDGARPAVMLTPVDSFASAGIEVEIDAVAVRDRDRAEAVGKHGTEARHHGDVVFAVAVPPDPAALPETQTDVTVDALFAALEGVGVGPGDICRFAAYLRADLDGAYDGVLERLGRGFVEPGPVFETMPLTRLGRSGEVLRLEAVALRGTAAGARSVRRLSQDAHWRWPARALDPGCALRRHDLRRRPTAGRYWGPARGRGRSRRPDPRRHAPHSSRSSRNGERLR